MSLTHQQADELLAAYVLDATDGDEAAAVRQHLETCAECRDTARRLGSAVESLALSAPAVSPPPALRARLLAAAMSESPPPRTETPAHDHVLALPQRRIWPRLAAVAMAAAVVGLAGWNITLQRQLGEQHQVSASFHSSATAASGSLVYLPQQTVTLVSLQNLPARTDGRVYELWVLPTATAAPQPAGTFVPDSDGAKVLVVPGDLSSDHGMAVSVEPAGGSPAPTTAPFLSATF